MSRATGSVEAVAGAPEREPRRLPLAWMALVLLVALAARGSWLVALAADDGPVGTSSRFLLGDERAYDAFARHVAAGTLDRERAFYQEPFYAWTIGQLYRVFPPPPIEPGAVAIAHAPVHRGLFVVQHLLGALTALAVASLGARVLGRRAGLLAGLLAALSGPAIFLESQMLKEGPALLLWVATLHLWLDLLEDRGRKRVLLLGLLLGLGVLLRGNTYLLMAAVVGSCCLRFGGRRRLAEAAIVVAVALLTLSPATLHNLRRGELVLSTYQSGTNAAIGQPDHPDTWRGVIYEPLRAGRGDALFEEDDAVGVAEEAVGRRLTGPEVSRFWWGRVADVVSARPAVAAERVARKAAYVFHPDEVPDVKDWAFFRQRVPWLGTPLSDLTLVGGLGLLGLLLLPWRGPGLLVVRGGLFAVALTLMLFYVMGRYRLAAAPSLWILAAGLLVSGVDSARRVAAGRQRAGRLVAGVVLALAVVLLLQRPLRPDVGGLQVSYANLGSIHLEQASRATDTDTAERHRQAALDVSATALRLAPDYPEARVLRIRALDLSTPWLEARRAEADIEAWLLLAVVQGHRIGANVLPLLDRPPEVVRRAVLALRERPGLPERELYVSASLAFAVSRVAQSLRAADELPLALELVNEALARDPQSGVSQALAGLLLRRSGRPQEAEAAYRRALELGTDTVEVRNNLGNLLLGQGRAEEALEQFRQAARLAPGQPVVQRNIERAQALLSGAEAPPDADSDVIGLPPDEADG